MQDEKDKAALSDCMNRVRTMANIHTQLYQSQDLNKVNFSQYLQDLVANISQSYGRSASPVKIQVDVHELSLNIDNSIPCGLVLYELITNALKHAFPEGMEGKIHISMKREDNQMILSVSDTGIGFPESVDVTNLQSLGMTLVNILVGQMNGKIDMKVDGGTTWTITFPLKQERQWQNG